jgi:two-component system, response regulator PdtaR
MSVTARRPIILIVEDDFLTRMNTARMIEDAGFDVVEAANADEAIVVLETRLDITVVFTDVQMPGSMDGLKLAAFIRGGGRPLRSSPPLASLTFAKAIFPKAHGFCRSPAARIKLSERCAN